MTDAEIERLLRHAFKEGWLELPQPREREEPVPDWLREQVLAKARRLAAQRRFLP